MNNIAAIRADYYLALGAFVDTFANVEELARFLYLKTMHYIEKEPKDFAKTALKTLMKDLLAVVRDDDALKGRDVKHFLELIDFRNKILHHSSREIEGEIIVTNSPLMDDKNKIVKFRSDPETLNLIIHDLDIIYSAFNHRFMRVTPYGNSELWKPYIKESGLKGLTPWKYSP